MSKYIDADALSESVNEMMERHSSGKAMKSACLFTMTMLVSAPAADVAPVRHGQWETEQGRDTIKCSLCGFRMFPLESFQKGEWPNMSVANCGEKRYVPHFCPDCGAQMSADRASRGRWIHTGRPGAFLDPPEECLECSECGYQMDYGERLESCPHCGAKMDVETP